MFYLLISKQVGNILINHKC